MATRTLRIGATAKRTALLSCSSAAPPFMRLHRRCSSFHHHHNHHHHHHHHHPHGPHGPVLLAVAAVSRSTTAGLPSIWPCGLLRRSYSSSSPAGGSDAVAAAAAATPPLLAKLRADLKAAMKARDAARLSVVRGALAAVTNLSKTATPVTSDAALVSAVLLRAERAGAEAAAEFRAAGRDDLAGAEEAQLAVIREYVAGSGVEVLSAEGGGGDGGMSRLEGLVQGAVQEARRELGEEGGGGGGGSKGGRVAGVAMKKLMAPGGALDGKVVDKSEVARLVKEMVG